jgi:hypothetical protein
LDINKIHIIYDINSNNKECLNDEDELQPWTAENVIKVVNEIQESDSYPEDVVVSQSVGYSEESFEISNCSLPEIPKSREKPLSEDECLYDKNIQNIYIKAFKKDNNKSKHNRQLGLVHACLYCHKLFTNIVSHMEKGILIRKK